MSQMDDRLLVALRAIRDGKWVYGVSKLDRTSKMYNLKALAIHATERHGNATLAR